MSTYCQNRYSTTVRRQLEQIKTEPWALNPNITYLNHGSFGARVGSIFDFQLQLKRELEESPVDFLDRHTSRLVEARNVVSKFLGADTEGFGFVDNATTAIGCVFQSVNLKHGDEILVVDHVYNGVRQLLKHKAKTSGCSYREIKIGLPVTSSELLYSQVTNAITSATRILAVDHVASATSVIFPVKEIAAYCKKNDVLSLVDGAHAPGMLDLNILDVDADWYVGNLHKWVCAPLGAAFIWASKEQRKTTHPMTLSHPYGEGFSKEFEWQGTRDITSWLTAAEAIIWGQKIGWDRIRLHNHGLATNMQEQLVNEWKVEPQSPLDGSMIGNMATIRLPEGYPNDMDACLQLRDTLYASEAIEIPVFEFQGLGMVRISAQLYSSEGDIKHLIKAMKGQIGK